MEVESSARRSSSVKPNEKESPMEALPEELLLHILGYMDPEDLLLRVPSVCKRWYRLARDTTVWRHQVLTFRHCKEEEFIKCVRRSPLLRKLDCSGVEARSPAEGHLLAIRCAVSHLVLGDEMDPMVALRLVERCASQLDTLVVGRISLKKEEYVDLMRSIDFSRLRVLMIAAKCSVDEYSEFPELVACQPDRRTLRHLEVWSENKDDMPVQAIVKLIRSHSESLRHLSHEYMQRRPTDSQERRVMEAVAACRSLQEARVWSSRRLQALNACDALRSLTLTCDGECRMDNGEQEDGGEAPPQNLDPVEGRACEEFFTKSPILPNLRKLCLRFHECTSCNVLPLLAVRCPNLEVLAIQCSATDSNVNDHLMQLNSLRALTLIGAHYMHPDMLMKWTEGVLPELRELVLIGTVRFCPWVCWAKSVTELRRLRPWLLIKLRECEHFHYVQ